MKGDLSGMLEILACPRTKRSLIFRNGNLETGAGEFSYEVTDEIPDLLLPPEGNVVLSGPWYEPWDDLASLFIEYPQKSNDRSLPYHLDAYLAGCFPEKGENRWVVEVGCGERQNESWFEKRGFRYLGFDVDSRGVGPNAFADAHNLPLKDSSVDFLTSMAVMEHLVSPQLFAQEVYRSLKPGGQFIGSAAFIYGFHDRASFYHMSHAGLLHCLNSSGLRVKQMWPDWKYTDSIPDWPYRGAMGFPWRLFTKASLKLAHWSFVLTSQIGRAVLRKPKLRDPVVRDIEIAGSISFIAEKPLITPSRQLRASVAQPYCRSSQYITGLDCVLCVSPNDTDYKVPTKQSILKKQLWYGSKDLCRHSKWIEGFMTKAREASSPPFFVVGSVRSGTTLLRLILGHHSKICRCDEMEFVAGEIVPADVEFNTSQYIHNLKLDRGFRLSGYHIPEDLSFSEIAHDFLHQRQMMDQKEIVGATVHHNFDELPDLWPDARFIYINRDPRDVARSCVQLGWAGTTWYGANFWLNANDCWQRLCSRVPDESCISLSFEDLVAHPRTTMERICKFLDVEYEPAMLDIEADTTYSRPDPESAKSWEDLATRDEIAQVETRIGLQRLIDNGYSPSGFPQLQNTTYLRLRIQVVDALVRVRVRIQKYGLKLWLKGFVTRRLPLRQLREAVQLEIDQIENSLMK